MYKYKVGIFSEEHIMKRPASVLPLYYVDFISATPSSCVQSPDPNKIYSFPIYQSLEILITSEKLYPCHFGHLRRRGILKIFAHILCTDLAIVGPTMFIVHACKDLSQNSCQKIRNYFVSSSILVNLDFKMSMVQRKEAP